MRRADRLLKIIQIFQRKKKLSGRQLAEELEISLRTVYRDVQDLIASGVPIVGEAGFGYILQDGYDLPPMMFTMEEMEALLLGSKMVIGWADKTLARAAADAITKIQSVVPKELENRLNRHAFIVPEPEAAGGRREDRLMTDLRLAIRQRRKFKMLYEPLRGDGKRTRRVIWPLSLLFWGRFWMVTAWCELRKDFRNFRLDCVRTHRLLANSYPDEEGKRLIDYVVREGYQDALRSPV